MMKRLMPSLLIDSGKVVKTKKFRSPSYIGDPINSVRIFNECEVDELVIFDISSRSKEKTININLLKQIATECFMPLTYGGRVRTIDDFDRLFNLGIEKISVSTLLHENPDLVSNAISKFGSQSVVACIDIEQSMLTKKSKIRKQRHYKKSPKSLLQMVTQLNSMGIGETIIHNVTREGTWQGFDNALLTTISDKLKCPVVALGGASSIEDAVVLTKNTQVSGAAIGSASVYQKKNSGVLVNFPNYKERQVLCAN